MRVPPMVVWWILVSLPLSAAGQTATATSSVAAEPSATTVDAVPSPAVAATLEDALHALSAPAAADRRAAIVRLSELGDRTAVPNLMIVLRQDPDAEVRRYAAVALANLGDVIALPALQDAAAQDPAAAVRASAAETVRVLGGTVTAPAPPSPPVAPSPPPPPPPPAWVDDGRAGGTAFVFDSDDAGVEIHRVIAEHTIWVGGAPGHYAAAQSSELLCRTPCQTSLPNGSYTLLADGYEFDVEARGGTQQWTVDGRNAFGYWSGFFLTMFGAVFGVTGGIMLGVFGEDDMLYDMNLGFLISGLAALAIGIPVWIVSWGGAEQTTGGGGSAVRSLAVGVAPGGSAWSLALRLDL
jgi:hypothetical protein